MRVAEKLGWKGLNNCAMLNGNFSLFLPCVNLQ
jgi:hypothetical protein